MSSMGIYETTEEKLLLEMVRTYGHHSKERTQELQSQLDRLIELRDQGKRGFDSKISTLSKIIEIRGWKE